MKNKYNFNFIGSFALLYKYSKANELSVVATAGGSFLCIIEKFYHKNESFTFSVTIYG